MRKNNTGLESRLDINSGSVFGISQGAVLESYGASNCNMLPASGHIAFRNLELRDENLNLLTPSFQVLKPDPECSMTETNASHGADIQWTP
jgi:hypothetical protein